MNPEISKPEWFQMADADAAPPLPKGKRAIRIMAIATPLFVLGAGLVFAQTQDGPTAVASAATSAASTPISSTMQVSQPSPTTQSASLTIKKPSIATMPTGGGPTGSGEDDGIRTSDDD